MRNFIIWIVTSLTFIQVAYAQEVQTMTFDIGRGRTITVTGDPSPKAPLKELKLKYSKPDGFNEVHKSECFDDNIKLKSMLYCISNQLVSEDEEFVAFFPLHRPYAKSDSISINKMFSGSLRSLNGMHLNELKHHIGKAYDAEAAKHWKDYVTYYSSAEAKTKFNADTAISYTIRLDSNTFYRGKYSHVAALLLQKKDLGFVCMTFFYTDRANGKLKKYWQAMEGMLRYEE